ncbi:MAG: hypothetical protein ACT4TC_13825 [Myxococcaceae bacterium]
MRPVRRGLLIVLWVGAAFGAPKSKVDFEDTTVEGEMIRPSVEYIPARQRPHFPCDATKLSEADYRTCYERYLAELCGVQVIERERFELHRVGGASAQSVHVSTIGSAYPFWFQLDDFTAVVQETSRWEDWRERKLVLREQSPKLLGFDTFVATPTSVLFGDRRTKRVFVLSAGEFTDPPRPFQKIELASPRHNLLGIVSNETFVVATTKELLWMGLDFKKGLRIEAPFGDYDVDPHLDRYGELLMVSRAPTGKVYLIAPNGHVAASFEKDPGFTYVLLPQGLVASANLVSGKIKIRNRLGFVLSQATVKPPLSQFGLYRQADTAADLFYVGMDGVGVLYADGFEKSFLKVKDGAATVVEAENGLLAVLLKSPGRDDPSRVLERRLDYYRLGKSGSRVSKLVDGICPSSIFASDQALQLSSSLKASVKEGTLQVYR